MNHFEAAFKNGRGSRQKLQQILRFTQDDTRTTLLVADCD